ncbi:tRNA (guanosine(46)-N7)-methyltransferase TrmB [Parachlamydia sp. AcF125]|uniref:tRNA (guanosine(46)-N7)-methyltransferase TrmB n=1 Tax=Parachlamydia sp. AcF125 TaxID=2795736 RepID=UPI001BC9BEEA|nr:tRNA (guanosine(46)-N7)-methyltransferase TrmB [Parachlamydia sp. AcF125]MBS4169142.1 tRNA (guanine-N(7)-)-methyltransferase [Parachlamydia sp. AcF125]
MKPEDLKSPFREGERKILIEDRVWYIPLKGLSDSDPFSFPGWEDPCLFGNSAPVHVEYCSGNGAWITEKAAQNPSINWVAVEKKFDRVRKIWAKIKNLKLSNLVVISGEGLFTTQRFFPQSSVEAIYVNFPDPWPKKRHAKNRLIQPVFVQQMARILKPSGSLTLVTDSTEYSAQMIEVVKECVDFNSSLPAPYYKEDGGNYGSSYFEQLWKDQGRAIRYHLFQKKGMEAASSF